MTSIVDVLTYVSESIGLASNGTTTFMMADDLPTLSFIVNGAMRVLLDSSATVIDGIAN